MDPRSLGPVGRIVEGRKKTEQGVGDGLSGHHRKDVRVEIPDTPLVVEVGDDLDPTEEILVPASARPDLRLYYREPTHATV